MERFESFNNATYSYLANSPLVSQIAFKQNTTTRMTTSKQYDLLNRLLAIRTLNPQQSTLNSHEYLYNNANQRVRATLADGSFWVYEYDALGQVRSGKRYWPDWTPVAGQQFEYGHDDIGNRKRAKSGGDESGLNLRQANYTPNSLNQYTSRTVPGYREVLGVALADATVTVNSQSTYRRGEYFRKELSVANSSAAAWQSVSVAASGETTVNGNVFVPKTPETFGYDLDGNMTNDGRWVLTWDAENRLIKVESLGTAPTASKRKVEWTYDYRGRRVRQTTYDGSSGSYVVTEDLKFVSDGWRHTAELNAANNALVRSYVWGLDLSGTMDGAGGVGGLLMLNSVANGVHFHAYDGNGNVAGLVKASDGTVSAIYEYDPFGQTIRATGSMADENRFQFSTKRCDRTTDFLLYEYRILRTDIGRWLSRDPIGPLDSLNEYGLLGNAPADRVDVFGLAKYRPKLISGSPYVYNPGRILHIPYKMVPLFKATPTDNSLNLYANVYGERSIIIWILDGAALVDLNILIDCLDDGQIFVSAVGPSTAKDGVAQAAVAFEPRYIDSQTVSIQTAASGAVSAEGGPQISLGNVITISWPSPGLERTVQMGAFVWRCICVD